MTLTNAGANAPTQLELARSYRDRGWRPFPLAHGTKNKPLVRWGEATREPASDAQLAEWFGGEPRNIGIACGPSGLVVVDADTMTALAQAAADRGAIMPDTYTVRTGKGRHYYLADPANLYGNSAGALRAYGCDVRGGHGHGGYVLAAGSVHPTGAVYAVEVDRPVASMLPWIGAMLAEDGPSATVTELPSIAPLGNTPPPGSRLENAERLRRFTVEAARDYIERECLPRLRASREPGRNEELNKVACMVGHLVPAFLTEAAARAWLLDNAPAGLVAEDGREQCLKTIRSGLSKGMTEPAELVEPTAVLDGIGVAGEEVVNTWRPKDLTAALEGHTDTLEPTVGIARADGARFLFPGKEHAVNGETEAGKSWFALACCAAELLAGQRVVYVHFEEDDETETVLRLLNVFRVPADRIRSDFLFVGPAAPVHPDDIAALCSEKAPSLAVLDGVNEGMSLHGQKIREEDGAAMFRRRVVKPFTRYGAAVLSLDHVVKDREAREEGYGLGSVHKMNGLSGAGFLLKNRVALGEGRRGESSVYVVKDRKGKLRRLGVQRDPLNPRKYFVGQMILDSTGEVPVFEFVPPAPEDVDPSPEFAAERARRAAEAVDAEILAVASAAITEAQAHGQDGLTKTAIVNVSRRNRNEMFPALDRLVASGRLVVVSSGSRELLAVPEGAPTGIER